MYNFPAIVGMLKALLLNFRSNKPTYTSETVKFLFSLGGGVWMLFLLFSYNEVPTRTYSVNMMKMFESNPKDVFGLKIDIGYDEKSYKPLLKDYERGAKINIIPRETHSTDSMRNLKGRIHMSNQYDTLVINPSDEKFRKAVPFIDSVKLCYFLTCTEIKIPSPNYNIGVDNDTLVESYTVKLMNNGEVDSVFTAKRCQIVKLSEVKENGITKIVSSKIFLTTDTCSNHEISMPASTSMTSYNIFSYHDISQSNYIIKLNLPSYKQYDGLRIDFGGATDFSPMYPSPDRIEMSSIFYNDVEKMKIISDRGLKFNAKFRELENLQMIRLFFITTLLGFLIGLFFSSLWNLLLLGVESYRKRKALPE